MFTRWIQLFFVTLFMACTAVAQQDGRSILSGQEVSGAARISRGISGTLSFEQAVQLALENNLATLLARERRNEARGEKQQALSPLLPQISGAAYQADTTTNLVALGFQPGLFPGLNATLIGPFRNFDARVRLSQSIFDLSAIQNYRAGRAGVRIAELREALAREQVVSATGLIYIEALRADRSVAAAQANVELAQALVKLAQDQRNAGIATGVDVTRAQTRLAEQQVSLAQAQTASEQARLSLQRVIGLPLGSALSLTDQLRFEERPLPTLETAVAQAQQDRREIQVVAEQNRVSELELKSARAEYLPSLEVVGDYGSSGITPALIDLPTRSIALQLNVPIFNGGLTRGRVTSAESRLRQSELQLSNVRNDVEEDVRVAMTTLNTAAAQVRAANESVSLGQRELEMARDRFRAGVGDNLEVVSAQTSLALATQVQVTALAQHNAARLNLATALGRAEAFRW
ncbi:MAG TPA: TolC family protein [Pyrinomonadaceae bacterium]|nr:TolC family protein [Pyrinomonadaceae bacterium]